MSAAPRTTTRTVRKPRKRDISDYRVYGYVLNEDALLEYALKHRLCTDADVNDDWHKGNAIAAAANLLLAEYNDSDTLVAGVLVKGKVRVCGLVASELEDDHMP
ncbi:hypothetical protein DFH06DRAFT_1328549 [Mycena polygramma]|nr:hypothetical protein DFH06DRAFT_1328549 [Mycena polygramma]